MAIFMIIFTILSVFFILICRLCFQSHFVFSRIYLWYKKQDRYGNLNYFIIATISFICVSLYIGLRWSLAIQNIANFDLFNAQVSEFRSANLSIFFMLDLCSILGIVIPLLCIFDWKNKRMLKPLSYLAILGGFATILFTIPDLYHQWSWQSLIVGSRIIGNGIGDEPLMFLMHYWMIMLAFIVIVSTTKVTLKNYLTIIFSILIYTAYIFIVSHYLFILSHVTAIAVGDYMNLWPSYYRYNVNSTTTHPSYAVLLFISNNWQLSAAIAYICFALITHVIILIKNVCYYQFSNRKLSNSHIIKNSEYKTRNNKITY